MARLRALSIMANLSERDGFQMAPSMTERCSSGKLTITLFVISFNRRFLFQKKLTKRNA